MDVTPARFSGFPELRSNVTFTPVQFFTVVVPHSTRGTVRLVSHMIRKVLGWVDEHGNPTEERLTFSYQHMIDGAHISRGALKDVIQEAVSQRFIKCVKKGRKDELGKAGSSAVYELNWDFDGAYTDTPELFDGFFYPQAAVVESTENGRTVPKAKPARKNIPNAFFDYLIPQEKLSVIRAVGALLFYSIDWGKGGERKIHVSKSITELSNLTKLSRHHTHEAITEAINKGYVKRILGGVIDFNDHTLSKPATYAINWVKETAQHAHRTPTKINIILTSNEPSVQTSEQELLLEAESTSDLPTPVQKGERAILSNRFKKVNEDPVQKGERNRFKKVNEDRFKKVNGIILKPNTKTSNTTANEQVGLSNVPNHDQQPAAVVEGLQIVEELMEVGFTEAVAKRLASTTSEEVIRNQILWLPRRTAANNRLGLLRRAIEENWGEPQATRQNTRGTAGECFAKHYYAAYHQNNGTPTVDPFPKDIQAAESFLLKLGADNTEGKDPADLGRQFGALVRSKHQASSKSNPHFTTALVLFGEQFARDFRKGNQVRRTSKSSQPVQDALYEANKAPYMHYLRGVEKACQKANRALYEVFIGQRKEFLDNASSLGLRPETIGRFTTEESRLTAFAEFCGAHPELELLEFSQWVKTQSLNTFHEENTRP